MLIRPLDWTYSYRPTSFQTKPMVVQTKRRQGLLGATRGGHLEPWGWQGKEVGAHQASREAVWQQSSQWTGKWLGAGDPRLHEGCLTAGLVPIHRASQCDIHKTTTKITSSEFFFNSKSLQFAIMIWHLPPMKNKKEGDCCYHLSSVFSLNCRTHTSKGSVS